MERILTVFLLFVIMFFIAGCESEEERLQRRINETEQQTREAIRDYNETQKDIYEYEKYRSRFSN